MTGTRFYDVSEPGTLHANTDLVTEKQFLPTVGELAAELGDPVDDQAFFTATIVPEPDNPRSELGRALSVRWKDRVIGYLSSEDADRYQQLRRIVASGCVPVTRGRLFVAARGPDPRPTYFLSVSLREPEVLIPLNDPPAEPWVLLPHGRKVQVTGESAHLDVLLDRVPRGGVGQVLVSLHEITDESQGAPLIEVRLDGQRIGQLPAGDSADFLPAVQHFERQGSLTVARARLTGSPLSAQVTLLAAKAADLTEEDLSADVRPLPTLVDHREDARLYSVPDAFQGAPAATKLTSPRPDNPFTRPKPAPRAPAASPAPPAPPMTVRPGPPVSAGPQLNPQPNPQVGEAFSAVSTVLLWMGIITGAFFVLGGLGLLTDTVVGGLGGIVFGLSIIGPCVWPMVCRSRDRKALASWEKEQETNRELASYLTEEDALVARGLAPVPRPDRTPRQWGKVGTAAGIAVVVGLTLMVVGDVGDVSEEFDEGPGVSSAE